MTTWLHIKHSLLRTPLEAPAQGLRKIGEIPAWIRHPELREIYLEPDRVELALRQIIKPASNCIDIGCHIGSSLSFLVRQAPRGKHTAFEPVPMKAEWLRKKFPEVDVKAMALGEKRDKMTFYQNLSRPGYSGFGNDFDKSDEVVEIEVECAPLDDVVDANRKITFVKIDVEGAEILVLKGARQLIARDRPVILFESSHDGAPKIGLKREDLFALFVDELGYDVFLVREYLAKHAPLDLKGFQQAAVYPFQAFNFLAIPKRAAGAS